MLHVDSIGPVLMVTLDRPEVRNALNAELIQKLADTFSHLPEGTRAVVLSGSGEGFCAGGDLQWMREAANYTDEENVRDATKLSRLFRAIADCNAVTIAKIHGACFGGGCGLASACDVAIASDDAKFAFSEVKLGLIPATISPFVVARIGKGNAKALFATGEVFGSDMGLRTGLLHDVVSREELGNAVDKRLKSILASGPEAIRHAKQMVTEENLSHDECAKRLARARASKEGKEGVAAFLEKRKASFVVEWPIK